MPKLHLTDLAVKKLKAPEKGQVTYWCTRWPGFGVRVSQGGAKTFVMMHGERRKRESIGRYPMLSLAEARDEAKRVFARTSLEYGNRLPSTITFGEALHQFIERHCKVNNRASTAKETERLLRKHFEPSLGQRRLVEIENEQVMRLVDCQLARPSAANHAFTAARTFFRWCVRRRYIKFSPIEGMQLPARTASRERVLSDDELRQVWRTAGKVGPHFGTIVQLLILTGQRRMEIGSLRWDFVDLVSSTITLPGALTKNHREHTFPIGETTTSLLHKLPRKTGWVFPAVGSEDNPFSGWSKCKTNFDKLCDIHHWTLHDLRRTMATNMAGLGVAPHVVERLLNHASGTISGVAAIYNRFGYQAEMREAALLWENRLREIVQIEAL